MIKKFIWSLLLIVLLLITALVFITTTEKGLSLVWQQTSKYLPSEIKIASIDGKLTGPLKINNFNYQNDTLRVEFDQAVLKWSPARLWSSIFHVNLVEVKNLVVTQISDKSNDEEPFELPHEIELPLNIVIEKLYLDQFEFISYANPDPFRLNYAEMVGSFDDNAFIITELNVDGPLVNVSGNLQTVPNREYESQGELVWKYLLKDYPVLKGTTSYNGDLEELIVTQILQPPYDVEAKILLKNVFEQFAFNVNASFTDIDLQAIKDDLPEANLTGNITAMGSPDDVSVQASVNSNKTEYGTLTAKIDGNISKQIIEINDLLVSMNEKPTRLMAKGKIDLSNENSKVEISANWNDLNWPLLDEPQIKSKKGELTVLGTLDDYQLQSKAILHVREYPQATLSMIGVGDKKSLTLNQLTANILEGSIKGSSKIQWQPELKVQVDLSGKNINPQPLAEDWPGKLNFQLKAKSSKQEKNIAATFEQLQIDGMLRGYKMRLDAKGDYANEILNLQQFELSSGESLLILKGAIGEALNVSWKIDSDNINSLVPNTSGKISGMGIAKGSIKKPLLKGTLSGNALRYQEYNLESLKLDMDVDLANKQDSNLTVELDNVKINKILIKTAKANLAGTLDSHSLNFNLDSNQGNAQLELQGELTNFSSENATWNFQLKQAKLNYPDLAPWALQSASNGSISKSVMELSDTCLSSDQARLCFDGRYKEESLSTQFAVENLPFSYFGELLPPDLSITGEANGKGTYVANKVNPSVIDIRFDTTATELLLPDSSGEPVAVVAFKSGSATLNQNETGLQATFSMPLLKNGGIDFSAQIVPGNDPIGVRPLTGDIKIQIDNLSDYAELVPQTEKLRGKVAGEVTLTGNLNKPIFNGQLMLQDAGADLPDFGLALSKMNLALAGTDTENLYIKGSVNSGAGTLNVDGTLGYSEKGVATELKLQGEKFEIYNTQDAHIYASPDLQIKIAEKKINIEGEVLIPKANITPRKYSSSAAVTVSEDQVIVVPEGEEQINPYLITTKVKVELGSEVYFSAQGLDAELTGGITVTDKPKRSTRAKGELQLVDGIFHAYGQELDIKTGKIIFTGGPIDQPSLDLRATREPRENILVGIEVRGRLNNPNIKLFSDPSMSRAEQLSYLTLGKPLQDASAGESSALNQAALSIGLSKGSKITDEIGKKLGFDNAGFESARGDNGDQSAFVLGKYLSPKLYISYGVGVFEPINIFRLQYFLTKHWKLVSESSGGNSGGDIFYEIERGK